MPWKEQDVMDVRTEFIYSYLDGKQSFKDLCKVVYGVSTKTGYKWRSRFIEGGLPALEDIS